MTRLLVIFCWWFVYGFYCFANDISKTIRVNFSEKTLIVEKTEGGISFTEAEFLVALPRKAPQLPVYGKVAKVELHPTWYPTEATRKYYSRAKRVELPKSIPPGHPLNALGVGAVYIEWEGGFNPLIRIHGTNDPKSIGQRITRGCVRLKNEDFLKLKNLIQGFETFVIFE